LLNYRVTYYSGASQCISWLDVLMCDNNTMYHAGRCVIHVNIYIQSTYCLQCVRACNVCNSVMSMCSVYTYIQSKFRYIYVCLNPGKYSMDTSK